MAHHFNVIMSNRVTLGMGTQACKSQGAEEAETPSPSSRFLLNSIFSNIEWGSDWKFLKDYYPTGNYMFKVNNRNTRTKA